ncbi:unnamed protein product [Pleuronectes platessa]|uniref:Uncharacterized protein n=1 Tax=Pleuronectes platessa TaxID=8262 RepID=A0A9N7YUS3_PLEPL|nr:unnamed protein product [Pleuronectes platessa]
MRAARKALRGAAERHGEGVPRWRGRSYLSVFVKTEKHTLALNVDSVVQIKRKLWHFFFSANMSHPERTFLDVAIMEVLPELQEANKNLLEEHLQSIGVETCEDLRFFIVNLLQQPKT